MAESVRQLNLLGDPLDLEGLEPLLERAHVEVVAVGTTSMRALESACRRGDFAEPEGDTDIFTTPGFEFQAVDALITNFHLPKSTLLMLVSAFAGYERIMAAYILAHHHQRAIFSCKGGGMGGGSERTQ